MSETLVVVAVGGVWLAIGIALSVVMGRRGHSGFGWLSLGVLLGPLAVLLAVDSRRHDERMDPEVVRPEGVGLRGHGPVDVLVGYDGSPESVAALHAATAILGERLGRLTVATVAPYGDVREAERTYEELLRRLDDDVPGRSFRLEVLHGQPARALREHAVSGSYALIAVGTRGRGLAKAILGSAASQLASTSATPVLLVGGTVPMIDVTRTESHVAGSAA